MPGAPRGYTPPPPPPHTHTHTPIHNFASSAPSVRRFGCNALSTLCTAHAIYCTWHILCPGPSAIVAATTGDVRQRPPRTFDTDDARSKIKDKDHLSPHPPPPHTAGARNRGVTHALLCHSVTPPPPRTRYAYAQATPGVSSLNFSAVDFGDAFFKWPYCGLSVRLSDTCSCFVSRKRIEA